MITKLTVESFKSLESVTVDLGQVNVFIGANGSGKSNLLEALGVLGAAAFGRVDDESLTRRGVRPGVPKLFKSSFSQRKGEKATTQILFEARENAAAYRVCLGNPTKDPNPVWQFESELLERLPGDNIVCRSRSDTHLNPEQGLAALKVVELANGDPALKLFDDLRSYGIYCANTPTLRGLTPDQQLREPLGLSGGRLPEAVSELSRRKTKGWPKRSLQILALIDWAKAFDSAPSSAVPLSASAAASKRVVRFTDRFMSEGRNVLTGHDASEGALYVLFAAVLALHARAPSLFAIDNLDQALNPQLSKRLAESLCMWLLESNDSRQVLLTAHSPTVLDGLPLSDDRVRLFTVDRDNRGHTVVRRVELTEKLLTKAAEGWTLSRLWVNGLIGGVPNV
jgi:putative AbiEii toxin of type IV toxin-antitoxin system/AAA ATPase-like protein